MEPTRQPAGQGLLHREPRRGLDGDSGGSFRPRPGLGHAQRAGRDRRRTPSPGSPAAVPPAVATFLLTSLQDAAAIADQQRRLRTTTVQICDRIERGSLRDLRRALPGIGLVQVVHVTGPESLEEAVAIAPSVDALLLDSGNPSLAVKELGGTGRRHDWRISRQIREAVPVPVFLAGGLGPRTWRRRSPRWGPSASTSARACARTAASIRGSSTASSPPCAPRPRIAARLSVRLALHAVVRHADLLEGARARSP